MNDYQVLDRLRNNDSQGLEYLFKKYYEFLVKTAYYLTFDKQVAEDLTQEIFVKLWERRGQLPDILNFKSYLTRMARNSALDHLKKNDSVAANLEQYLYFKEDVFSIAEESPEDLKNKISEALGAIPPKCRLIFSMSRFEGLTNDEISKYLEISKRTVETQITKALRILRKQLKPFWEQRFLLFLW